MSRLRTLGLATLVLALGGPARADALVFGSGGNGVTTDLLDVAQGATVSANSAMGFNAGISSDPRSAIGFVSNFIEPTNTIFENGGTAGVTVDFINFQTAAPVALRSYAMRLADDSNVTPFPDRGTLLFRFFGGFSPGALVLLSQATVLANYQNSYGSSQVTVTEAVNGVGMQFFRVELTRATSQGPRIIEIDGFSTVPEPSGLLLAGLGVTLVSLAGWRARARRRLV